MSVILVDLVDEKHNLQINWWNWRPILAFLLEAELIDEDQFKRMGANCCGGQLTSSQAKKAAAFLEQEVILRLSDGEQIHTNGKVSIAPVESRPVSSLSSHELYATHKSCLESFVAFCNASNGFKAL